MKNKGLVITSIVVGSLILLGVGGYFVAKEMTKYNSDQLIRDEYTLKIGIAKESKDQLENVYSNYLSIQVYDNGNRVVNRTISTDDLGVWSEEKNYKGFVFVDLTESMKQYTDHLGINFWHKSNPNRNYILIQSSCGATGFASTLKEINDSGRWVIDIPLRDGQNVSVVHSNIYIDTSFSWGK